VPAGQAYNGRCKVSYERGVLDMLSFLTLALGIVLMIAGGTLLVRGASDVATSAGVSPMIVGLTVIGFGTSSPELVVNTLSVAAGAPGLAFGNVVGSNISNMALVLGAAALMAPITIQGQLVRREIPLLLLITTVLTVMSLDGLIDGGAEVVISRSDSIILLLLFLIFMYVNVQDVLRTPKADPLLETAGSSTLTVAHPISPYRWPMVVAGLVMLVLGGHLTVDGGSSLAESLGVPTEIIGLFVVAVGTSMPELVTSIIAAMRKEADLALGNVIGSNLFNVLIVLPAGGLIAPIPVPAGGVGDILLSWLLVALLLPVFFLGKAQLSRPLGGLLVAGYFAYASFRAFA